MKYRPGVLACMVLAALALFAQQRLRTIDDAALRNAGKDEANAREWISYGGNYAETRFSLLKQITAANVSKFGLASAIRIVKGKVITGSSCTIPTTRRRSSSRPAC